MRQLETALTLMDSGAQSPRESWLRLQLMRAGLPRPETQIPVVKRTGEPWAYLDMGWRAPKVAVEYDGGHHQTERGQYVRDIRRRERLEQLGWLLITVVAEDRPADIVDRARGGVAIPTIECVLRAAKTVSRPPWSYSGRQGITLDCRG